MAAAGSMIQRVDAESSFAEKPLEDSRTQQVQPYQDRPKTLQQFERIGDELRQMGAPA